MIVTNGSTHASVGPRGRFRYNSKPRHRRIEAIDRFHGAVTTPDETVKEPPVQTLRLNAEAAPRKPREYQDAGRVRGHGPVREVLPELGQ